MKYTLKRLPLAVAVLGALSTQVATAQDEPAVTLDTLNVVVDRQGTKVKTNVVTLQEKDESTATDLRGLLQSESAIDFSGGTGTSSYLTIRGMGQNSVDVKVDNAYSDSQILYHQGRHMLDPSLVKIVSVQKGAGSASAGIGATNGAIIAKTVDAQDLLKNTDKDWGLKVNAGYSSNDEHSYGVTGFGKADNFDFLVSYNEVHQDNYKPGRKTGRKDSATPSGKYFSPWTAVGDPKQDCAFIHYRSATDNSTYCKDPNHPSDEAAFQELDKASYLIKAGYNLGEHRFVLSHFNTTNKGVRNVREEFPWVVIPPDHNKPYGTFTNSEGVRETNNGTINYGGYRELTMENTNLEYTGNAGALGKAEANAYVMKNSSEYADTRFHGYAGNTNGKTSVKTTGVNLGFDKQVNDDTLFKYGVNYRNQKTTPHHDNNGKPKTTQKDDIGVYGEVIGNIGNLTLTAGLRYDEFDYTSTSGKKVSDSAINPSVAVIYQATPALSFNANHYYATRSPRLVDALLSAGGRASDIVEGTKYEQAKNTEVGFNYNNGNFALDGTYFWQEIDKLLTAGQGARHAETNTNRQIFNAGYAKNKGWELNGRYRLNGLTARLGVAESDPKYYSDVGFNNREFGSTIGRTWTAGLAYRFAQPNLEVGVNHRKVEDVKGQSAWQTQVNGNRGNDLNMTKYGYDVTDIYANWKPLNNDKLNVNFAVNNVGDEYYYSHSAISGLPGVGREYRVGVNFTY